MGTVTAAGLVVLTMLATSVGFRGAPEAAAASGCSSGVPGDVNGDGYAEVAVGEPGNAQGRGAVHVFYGSRGGLVVDASGSALDDQYLTQDTPGVPGAAELGDAFGTSTLLADLTGDGCADLAVGSRGENTGAGLVHVFFGSTSGVQTIGVQSFTLAGLPGSPGSLDNQGLGDALAAGDVDGDGIDDLVAGAPGVSVGSQPYAGAVALVYGNSAGLDLRRSVLLTADTPGVPGAADPYGNFGRSVSTGDFDGNGTTELAVGSTGEGLGAVQVLARTSTGFSGSAPIGPDVAGLPGRTDGFCAFGAVLASGDIHGDGRDDLALGDPQGNSAGCLADDEYGTGAVALLPGSAIGLTGAGSQLWTPDSPGVAGTARLSGGFGNALALAPLDRDGAADLVIGAPYDGVAGSVTVLLGSASGLTTNGFGGSRYTQSSPGIPGTDESGDWFGQAVTAAFVQTPARATLVISAPREDVGGIHDAGSVTQIPIGASRPDLSAARTITADTDGVQGQARADEYFGLAR